MTAVERLVELVPPPTSLWELGYRPDWSRIESELGTRLPSDYKQLANLYGAGEFCDQVALLVPAMPTGSDTSSEEAFAAELRSGVDMLRGLDSFSEVKLWPQPDGLLSVANITTGSELLWTTSGPADDWQCVELSQTLVPVQHLESNVSTVILRWIQGQLSTDYLSPPVPPWNNGPYFESVTGRSLAKVRFSFDGPGLDRVSVETAVIESAGGEGVTWTDYEEGSHWTSLISLPNLDLAVRLRGGEPSFGIASYVLPSRATDFGSFVARLIEILPTNSDAAMIGWEPPLN